MDLLKVSGANLKKHAVSEILQCNGKTGQYGLSLTEQQASELIETRSHTLRNTGRIEFGGGIIDKIILEFCESPYLSQDNYEETLKELIDIFYCYKIETLDMVSDNDLIKYMKKCFDSGCHGSLELLKGRELEAMARRIRFGPDYDEDENEESETDDEQY